MKNKNESETSEESSNSSYDPDYDGPLSDLDNIKVKSHGFLAP